MQDASAVLRRAGIGQELFRLALERRGSVAARRRRGIHAQLSETLQRPVHMRRIGHHGDAPQAPLFENALGFDGHSPRNRAPRMADAYREVLKWAGQRVADRTFSTNGLAILHGLPLRVAPPQSPARRWWRLWK